MQHLFVMTKVSTYTKGSSALDNNDVFFSDTDHVRTVTLVAMQPTSDDIKSYAENIKNLCRCHQVRADPNLYGANSWRQNRIHFVSPSVSVSEKLYLLLTYRKEIGLSLLFPW